MKHPEPNKIWKVPVYLPYLKPALTDEMVKEAEARIGYKLPKEFIELLKTQNGGYIRYKLNNTPHELIAGIGDSFPSFTNYEWILEYQGAVSYELEGLFAFDGDGHWNLCLDYRKNKTEPEVTYIDTESDHEKKIADNFKEYLNLLTIETDGYYVVDTSLSIEETIKQISDLAAVSFYGPNTDAHGYPIYSAKLGDRWIEVSPNKAPAGFIRPNEKNYEELKHWMDKPALRYPELLETDVLLFIPSTTEGEQFLKTLHDSRLKITDMKTRLDQF